MPQVVVSVPPPPVKLTRTERSIPFDIERHASCLKLVPNIAKYPDEPVKPVLGSPLIIDLARALGCLRLFKCPWQPSEAT